MRVVVSRTGHLSSDAATISGNRTYYAAFENQIETVTADFRPWLGSETVSTVTATGAITSPTNESGVITATLEAGSAPKSASITVTSSSGRTFILNFVVTVPATPLEIPSMEAW